MNRSQKQMLTAWGMTVLAPGVMDWSLDQRHAGLTLSECLRALKDEVPAGDYIFTALCVSVPTWFWIHIMRPKKRYDDPQTPLSLIST